MGGPIVCTRVVWADAGGAVIVGRNMDFRRDLATNLWKLPRGTRRDDGVDGRLVWESAWGSVVATAFDMVSVDGVNEAGLAGHVLWLAESDYASAGAEQGAVRLSQSIWMQYFLDNFASVAESVAWMRREQPRIVPLPDPQTGEPPALHLALNDAHGDSAIIEYIDGEMRIHHGAQYRVMTNSPAYDEQLRLLSQVTGFGGESPLGGSTLATDRFARASYYVDRLPEPPTRLHAIASMFSVMRNVAQPFRIPDPGRPDASQTLWQTVVDLTSLRYVFESTTRPNVVWVDLADLDFSRGSGDQVLDLNGKLALEGGLAGNVAGDFESRGPLRFLSLADIPTPVS
ncbi:linear amide C-N hydrolase [Microbacterium xanthum]|uniref:linear amide C-N hydrolase n=1 Tax=Microbacterium xanthum TaxID=3079794 RepID=UPI002AD554DB|nr:linear amide C-N hydrolase [Microbacterium sp. KSW-48]MDZ8171535.1 linear amide C-N hydrolase [Microbacterium sp. KSW-48]